MNYEFLFYLQELLDDHIMRKHKLNKEEILDNKFLSLLVEAAELANETRCFKHWSMKGPSERDIILEEYVDILHFLLSIGNHYEFNKSIFWKSVEFQKVNAKDLTTLFIDFYNSVLLLRDERTAIHYIMIWDVFIEIGERLGFSKQDIYEAYLKKHKVNYARQADDY